MKLRISGKQIRDFQSFCDAIADAIAQTESAVCVRYFGFDLHSFGDCLRGGFLGTPPYEIEIADGEAMLERMGHSGLELYCRQMIDIIEVGGRGLVDADSRAWYEDVRRAAVQGNGPTLLDYIAEVVEASPASLTVKGEDGKVLVEWSGLRRRLVRGADAP